MNTKLKRDMKFALLYKDITLIVQKKCVKCIRVCKAPNRFYTIFKQLDIKTIINSSFFFFFLIKLCHYDIPYKNKHIGNKN